MLKGKRRLSGDPSIHMLGHDLLSSGDHVLSCCVLLLSLLLFQCLLFRIVSNVR